MNTRFWEVLARLLSNLSEEALVVMALLGAYVFSLYLGFSHALTIQFIIWMLGGYLILRLMRMWPTKDGD
jgi:hypothetical protein